ETERCEHRRRGECEETDDPGRDEQVALARLAARQGTQLRAGQPPASWRGEAAPRERGQLIHRGLAGQPASHAAWSSARSASISSSMLSPALLNHLLRYVSRIL